MKVGDLVRPIRYDPVSNFPIVENGWVGIIVDFTGISRGAQPIVYWNLEFQAEIEDPKQLAVIENTES